uniref:Uncharacterized protein n=1 Tax=Anguilla anguilla TaxID=7936 RepID=A0A0E9SST2_ANGAN
MRLDRRCADVFQKSWLVITDSSF